MRFICVIWTDKAINLKKYIIFLRKTIAFFEGLCYNIFSKYPDNTIII